MFEIKHSKKIENLNSDSINCVELLAEKNLLFSCSDSEIILYNLTENSASLFFKSNDSEINHLKCFKLDECKNDLLFALNDKYINIFDINASKQIDKFKFSKDTVNCIELNREQNQLACGDDTGEIKLLDFRLNNQNPILTLKKNLSQHENICFALKFNPLNEYELFSGSFDCNIIKWDTRFTKSSAKKPYLNKVSTSAMIQRVLSQRNDEIHELDYLASSMTPSFVHSLHFCTSNNTLLCGIENGLCMAFNPVNCELVCCKQIQPYNCALTQLVACENGSPLSSYANDLILSSGDGKVIDLIHLTESKLKQEDDEENSKLTINRLDLFSIKHKDKINSMKYLNGKLYVADTSRHLSIYDLKAVKNDS